MNPLKKENPQEKFFFQITLNEVLKMISPDVKANVKQHEMKDMVIVSQNLLQEVPSNFKMQCKKRAYIFNLILVGIPPSLMLSNTEGWGSLLN